MHVDITVVLSANASGLRDKSVRRLGDLLIPMVEAEFGIGKGDKVSFSADRPVVTKGGADVRIEVRWGEYSGRMCLRDLKSQEDFSESIGRVLKPFLSRHASSSYSASVCFMPQRGGCFEIC